MDNQQTIDREKNIDHANSLLRNGKILDAKKFVMEKLQQSPSDQTLRELLRSTINASSKLDLPRFIHDFEHIFMSAPSTPLQSAAYGWLYTTNVDKSYQDPKLVKLNTNKYDAQPASKNIVSAIDETNIDNIFSELLDIIDLSERWDAAQKLIRSAAPLITRDDFYSFKKEELTQQLSEAQNNEHLNIVILGAGCTGLTIANALARSFNDKVNILIIENRVQRPHVKKNYERNWLTELNSECLNGVIDPRVLSILRGFGEPAFLGTTIALFETLLLIANRQAGVKFLFRADYDLSFLNESKTQLIFDATGGRLVIPEALCTPGKLPPGLGDIPYNLPQLNGYGKRYRGSGITHVNDFQSEQILLKKKGNRFVPISQGIEIKSAMIKLTDVPMQLYKPMLDMVKNKNNDGLFYIWKGRLREPINRLLILINIDHTMYKECMERITEKQFMCEFLDKNNEYVKTLDPRIIDMFELISASSEYLDQIQIEPPFIYEPYSKLMTGTLDRMHGKMVVPIGDSIFNGHPKVGNGLSSHLRHMIKIHDVILFIYGIEV